MLSTVLPDGRQSSAKGSEKASKRPSTTLQEGSWFASLQSKNLDTSSRFTAGPVFYGESLIVKLYVPKCLLQGPNLEIAQSG